MASEKNAVSGGADPAGWIGKGFAVRGIDPVAHGGKRADEAARSRIQLYARGKAPPTGKRQGAVQTRRLNDFRGHVFDPGHKIFALWDRVRTRFSLSGVGKCIVLDGEGWC